jgi:hypothetical protein
MKAMSPSAIIFGPMIAIIAESLLLEASVRLLGRSIPGYIVGSMLAMSWNLFQKVFNMIIFYGGNLVEIYSSLTTWAEKQLNLSFDAFWAPLILLLAICCFRSRRRRSRNHNRPQDAFHPAGRDAP